MRWGLINTVGAMLVSATRVRMPVPVGEGSIVPIARMLVLESTMMMVGNPNLESVVTSIMISWLRWHISLVTVFIHLCFAMFIHSLNVKVYGGGQLILA